MIDINQIKFYQSKISQSVTSNMKYMNDMLDADDNFDIVYRMIEIGEKKSCIYFIDGFCKDELMQKILQFLIEIKKEDMPQHVEQLSQKYLPTIEVAVTDSFKEIETNLLSGVFCLFIEEYDKCILIDARTYPSRSVDEPDKDKALRGAKDGFVETIVFNTAMIRRRIRSSDLRMEMTSVGKTSKTDVVLCYMMSRVNKKLLEKVHIELANLKIDALTMNQESLMEGIFKHSFFNPFPKFKYTERPDTAAAQVLEGSIVILVDNSPYATILPITAFRVLEEADEYYFPPITGTYLRVSRYLILIMSLFLTPIFVLMINNPEWIPKGLQFIQMKENANVPVVLQFLMLEIAIDGLRLAAVNTPSMLSTPFSVLAALVLGEFSVNSGWFNSEVMLYMVFVAIASYTMASYEFSYAIKFFRIILLLATEFFGIYGFLAGCGVFLITIINTKTVSGDGYFYPIYPFDGKELFRSITRHNIVK